MTVWMNMCRVISEWGSCITFAARFSMDLIMIIYMLLVGTVHCPHGWIIIFTFGVQESMRGVWSHHFTTPDYAHLHLQQRMINIPSLLFHCPSWGFLTKTQPFGKCFEGRAPLEPCSSVPGRFLHTALEIFVEQIFWKCLCYLSKDPL